MTLYVDKTATSNGNLSELAHELPVIYGFAAVVLSGLAGFLASWCSANAD